ncbi:hypothetical protein BTHI11S_01687 [Bosea thiooxidans]
MQQALTAAGIVKSVQVTNVTGAGGTIGLAQLIGAKGDGHQLMVNGFVMVGAILLNKSPVNLTQVTPIARLTAEAEVIVVPADPRSDRRGRPGRAPEGRSGQGDLGRRLGRRHRSHPRRALRPGRRRRRQEDQLHPVLGRRRGPRGDARRPRHGRRLGLWPVRGPDQGRQAARARRLLAQAPAERPGRSDAEGAGHRSRAAELALGRRPSPASRPSRPRP